MYSGAFNTQIRSTRAQRLIARIIALGSAALLTACSTHDPNTTPVVEAPSDNGRTVLRDWLVAGPLPSPDLNTRGADGHRRSGYDRDFLESIGGETAAVVSPGTEVTVDEETVAFTYHGWDEDYLDITDVFGNDARVVAYLYAEIESETPLDVYLHVGTNDAGRVWLGGELVLEHPRDRGAKPSQNVTKVQLQAGRTPILMKIDQAGGGWGAYAEIYGEAAHEKFVVESFPERLAIDIDNDMPIGGEVITATVDNFPKWPGLTKAFRWQLVDSSKADMITDLPETGESVSVTVPGGETRDVYIRAITPSPAGGESVGERRVRATNLVDAYFIAKHRPDHIVIALGDDAETERRVAWRTQADVTGSAAQISPAADNIDWSTVASIEGSQYVQDSNRGPYAAHHVSFTGLAPGESYTYRVGDGSTAGWSDSYTFRMPALDETLIVVVLGDSRTRPDVWEDVVTAAAKHNPTFIVNSGDLISDGRDMNDWNEWFERAKDILPTIALMPVLGNHESQSSNYMASFALPENAASDDMKEQYWVSDIGQTRWIGLNSEFKLAEQTAWLDTLLDGENPPWMFAAYHRPAYTASKSRGEGNLDVRRLWSPIFDEAGVQTVWAGHDHFYSRSKSIRGEEIVGHGEGTIYITSGGAGAPLYDIKMNKWIEYAEKSTHYVLLEITSEAMKATVIRRPDGVVIDEFRLTR
jgi:acid phosphatase type 7